MATGVSLEFLEGKSLLLQVASVKVLESSVHKDDLQQRNKGEVNCLRRIQCVDLHFYLVYSFPCLLLLMSKLT